jgi:peptidyl-prolyl cis-trans isomerase-like 3
VTILTFRVIDGSDTLDALEQVEVNQKHRPLKEVRLQNVTIHANPLAEENLSF